MCQGADVLSPSRLASPLPRVSNVNVLGIPDFGKYKCLSRDMAIAEFSLAWI